MDKPPPNLTRQRAAEWFAAQGYVTITVNYLAKLASQGKGPAFAVLGKHAYYRRKDLADWVHDTLQPSDAGRMPARGRRGERRMSTAPNSDTTEQTQPADFG